MCKQYYIFMFIRILISRCSPVLVVKRAQKLRKETGDENYWAPLERKKLTFVQRLEEVVARPFKVLFAEPMLMALSLFMSVSTPLYSSHEFIAN